MTVARRVIKQPAFYPCGVCTKKSIHEYFPKANFGKSLLIILILTANPNKMNISNTGFKIMKVAG